MLNAMQVFVRVTEVGSFTSAAQTLGTSTAQVSRTIADLERHLQTRLLQRTTRKLNLTDTGRQFLVRSRDILHRLNEATLEAGQAQQWPRGVLKVHSFTGLGIQLLATLAGRYNQLYPDVCIELQLSQRPADLIMDGHDVLITLSRQLPDSDLVALPLGTLYNVICGSPEYLARNGTPLVPEDLNQHQCLRLADPVANDVWSLKGDSDEVINPGLTFKVNVAEAMLRAAEAGMGLCQLPDFVAADSLTSGKLLRVLPQFKLHPKEVYALYPSRLYLDAKTRTWLDFLSEELPKAFHNANQVIDNPNYWATVD